MSDLEPLPLDDVMAIVDRRARRQRVVLRSALGVGAVAAVVVGAQAVSRESEPGSEETPTASDDGATTSMPTTETTLPGDGERPEWQTEAAVHALDELGFQFTDAEVIAAQWGTDTYTPKVVVGEADRLGVLPEVRRLRTDPTDRVTGTDVQAQLVDAFLTAYEFSDAEAIAAQWGVGTSDAKLLIGVRVLAGEPIDDP